MAQRHRSTAGGPSEGHNALLSPAPAVGSSLTSPSSQLDPAPKHPLRLSPSNLHVEERSSLTTRRRRRQDIPGEEAEGEASNTAYDPKEKSDHDRSKPTTLDKLEGWLGLSSGEGSVYPSVGSLAPVDSASTPRPNRTPRPTTSRTTRLVLVHTPTAADTLDSLALRFNTDVRTLRRINGLWPGDSILVRKELYIPFEEEDRPDKSGVAHAKEGLSGKLMLLNSQTGPARSNGLTHPSRPMSTASASSASAASASHSSQQALPSPEVRRVPSESLSYFPPPGTHSAMKGKARREEAFGFGEQMRPGQDVDHGESGVDDLLQLAEKARSRGSSPPKGEEGTGQPVLRAAPDDVDQGSPSSSAQALEEPWKPNKWTFGQRKKPSTLPGSTAMHTSTFASMPDTSARGPAMMPVSSYQGWNDIPEPPLHRTAKGQVAHAYKGPSKSRRYPRPGVVDLAGSGTMIEDLAAGLPPNVGPASNWARPIADCLPLPGESSKESGRRTRSPSHQVPVNPGWAQILSDTVRGKMGLDEALERGLEDIGLLASRQGQTVSAPSAGRGTVAHHAVSSTPPLRPSAEMARVSLAEGQTTNGGNGVVIANGLEVRRSSNRSMHELENLAGDEEQKPKDWASTWGPSGGNGSGGSNVRGRRSARNVDWLV